VKRRSMVVTAALVAAAGVLALSGCKAPTKLDAVWPAATSEPVVSRPAGPARWPLTGLDAPSPEAVTTRIVSVKIENAPGARPQSGLDQADIVYETLTEGGITRFNALFQSHSPKTVGPVRSARPSDFSIVPQYHALFAHCGADIQVRQVLSDHTKFDDMDQFFNPSPYRRVSDRPAPHNLYMSVPKLRSVAISKRGYDATETVRGLDFVHAATTATPTVRTIGVAFSASNDVTWKYDVARHVYKRSINGKPHVDRVSGVQYTARNVVVLWATERRYTAAHNAQLLEIGLTGTGRASVFRDGQRYDGTWQASATSPPVLRASDGSLIGLDAGNTWFQVIGNDQDIMMN